MIGSSGTTSLLFSKPMRVPDVGCAMRWLMRGGLYQTAQHAQVAAVGSRLHRLRRLDDFGEAREARVVEQVAKRFQPDLALADVLVAIDARAEGLLRVVQMKRADVLQADVLLHVVDRARVA